MKSLVICILCSLSISALAQLNLNLEIGGVNYIGISLNAEYKTALSSSSKFYLAPRFGLGHTFFWENAMSAQGGLGFGYNLNSKNSIQFSSNIAYLFSSPFYIKNQIDEFYIDPGNITNVGDILWYNGFDYHIKKNKIRYTIGLGLLSGFWYNYKYEYAGGPIPMLKLGVGIF